MNEKLIIKVKVSDNQYVDIVFQFVKENWYWVMKPELKEFLNVLNNHPDQFDWQYDQLKAGKDVFNTPPFFDKVDKEYFIKNYLANSEMTEEELLQNFVVLPCSCGDKLCKGWVVLEKNNENLIKAHKELYT